MTGSPTMLALRKHAAGEHALHLDEVATPQARPGWVVLDVGYAGICGTDLHIVEDEFPKLAAGDPRPRVHGHRLGDR